MAPRSSRRDGAAEPVLHLPGAAIMVFRDTAHLEAAPVGDIYR